MLIADIQERPRSVSRTVDLVRGGLLARAAEAGLAGDALAERAAINASLAAFGCAVAAFLAFGVGLWSQLTIGWQWSAPDAPVIAVALPLMSLALAATDRPRRARTAADRVERRPRGRQGPARPAHRPGAADDRGRGRADRRRPPDRPRLAGNRRPGLGRPGACAARPRRLRVGGDPFDHVLLGASTGTRDVPA